MNLESILTTLPHNKFYLVRYMKFIIACVDDNKHRSGRMERHHICPKATDMFPQYASVKDYPWNICSLTPRQHYIAHWILFRTYRTKSSAFSLRAMAGGQANKFQTRARSRQYEIISTETRHIASILNKGMSIYKSPDGDIGQYKTDDPRVLSGELVSLAKGRVGLKHTEEHKLKMSVFHKQRMHNPNKMINLYFLDMKISVLYHSTLFVELLEQGWCSKCTREYRSSKSIENNAKRSPESRQKSAKSNSIAKLGKKRGPRSVDEKKSARQKDPSEYLKLYYNSTTNDFEMVDVYDITECHILVFTRYNSRAVYDSSGNIKRCSTLVPIPPGYYRESPSSSYLVYDLSDAKLKYLEYRDMTDSHIKIHSPNGNRVKVVITDSTRTRYNTNILYLTSNFIDQFGIPGNCRLWTIEDSYD